VVAVWVQAVLFASIFKGSGSFVSSDCSELGSDGVHPPVFFAKCVSVIAAMTSEDDRYKSAQAVWIEIVTDT
jgi:hypothetical protein